MPSELVREPQPPSEVRLSPVASPHWNTGDQVLLREVWRGRVWSAKPVTVVQDGPDLVALYMAPGTRWKQPRTLDGGPLRLPAEDWLLADVEWLGGYALHLATPGAGHSVVGLWQADGTFSHWHVNLQEPLRRTSLGFDYMDQLLDIVVSPDLSEWAWKDEQELNEAQARGLISPARAREIRAEGERVIELIRARRPPFSSGWEHWSPDPAWPIPDLPAGWDIVR